MTPNEAFSIIDQAMQPNKAFSRADYAMMDQALRVLSPIVEAHIEAEKKKDK